MAAFRSDMVWELRPDGSTNNGGGFTSFYGGTDYSQRATPILTVTDIVGNSTTTLTSVQGGFTNQMVGNVIQVLTQVVRTIVAVTNSNTITVDSATGTFSGQTANVGGAMTVGVNGIDPLYRNSFDAGIVTSGQKIWIRATNSSGVFTAYSPTAQPILSFSAAADNYVSCEGYSTTRGDAGLPTINHGSGLSVSGNYNIVRNIKLVGGGSGATPALTLGGIDNVVEDLILVPGANAQGITETGSGNIVRRVWCQAIPSNNGSSLNANGQSCLYDYCQFDGTAAGTGANGVELGASGGTCTFRGCIFSGADGAGVRTNNVSFAGQFLGCIFWNNTGDGLKLTQSSYKLGGGLWVEGCIFGKNGAYDVNYTVGDISGNAGAQEAMNSKFQCNWFYTTGTARYHNLPAATGDHALTVSPFVSDSTGNFSLNSTAGGGAAIMGTLCSAAFPNGLNTANTLPGFYGTVPASSSLGTMRSLWREFTNERSTTVVPDTTVDAYLNGGLQALNRRVRYHLTDTTTAVTLVAGQQEYVLPADTVFVAFIHWNGKEINKSDTDEWRRRDIDWKNAKAGAPAEWAHYRDKLILYPPPDAQSVAAQASLFIRYVSSPPDITASGPEQVISQDQRIAVYFGVSEFAGAHPDSALATLRAEHFEKLFDAEVEVVKGDYQQRLVGR